MESVKKVVLYTLIVYLVCGGSMAYTQTNSSITYTYDEIPARLGDTIVSTTSAEKSTIGGWIGEYMVIIFYFFIFILLIWVVRRWLQ